MSFSPCPPVAWCHIRARSAAGLRARVGPAGDFVAPPRTGQQPVDVDPLEGRGQEPYGRGDRGAAADPVPHRETGEPAFLYGDPVQLAVPAGNRHGMPRESETRARKGPFVPPACRCGSLLCRRSWR